MTITGLRRQKSERIISHRSQFIVHRSLLILCLLLAIPIGCSKQQEEKLSFNEVVIRINDREITLGEFQDVSKRLSLEGEFTDDVKDEELKDLKMHIVNQLVEEELLLEEARKSALDVTDNELSKEMEAIKKEYMGDTFESTIASRYGSIEKWEQEFKNKLLIKKVIDTVITSRLTVKEDEARRYYKAHITEYKMPEQVRARMIVVKTEDEANKVRERLKKGEDFAKAAQEVSLSPEGKKGGDLGFFSRGEMPKEFEDVVFSLPPGKISDVVKTAYGYHIFRVEERRDAVDLKFSQVKNKIRDELKREKSDAEFQAWMKALKEKAKIEVKEELL